MFYDQAKIFVKSGDGGDGCVAFRREKYVPRGGPAGGDGGKGGDVVLEVNTHLNTLYRFSRKRHFRAEQGEHGRGKNQTGADGADIVIEVPPGTVVRDANTEELLADLTEPGERFVVARGGRGGRGNARFASSTNQAPRMAERGAPGKELELELELKLLADVGLVGLPNAGKSTLLAAVSAARPKIAAYPFTTLQPNLGVAVLDDYTSLVIADIPGLIEGASQGAGLGHEFLRHIERTRMLIHLLDGAGEDPLEAFEKINAELATFDEQLAAKPQIVAFNKIDLPDAQALWPLVRDELMKSGYTVMAISGLTRQSTRELLYRTAQLLAALPPPETETAPERPILRPAFEDDHFTLERTADGWHIRGERIERLARIIRWDLSEAVSRFQKTLEHMGIIQALEKAGVKNGDTVFIGEFELEWGEGTGVD
jgi:GTP-binding protein